MIPYRDDRRWRTVPLMTIAIIAINAWVFFYEAKQNEFRLVQTFRRYGLTPRNVAQSPSLPALRATAASFVTSLFLHAGFWHFFGNMWFLWVFGEALEDDLGPGRFLGFYLFCGFFACIFHVLAASSLDRPMIGASGAIAGVLGGYLIRLPKSSICTIVFWRLRPETVYIPAVVWLGLWLALQFYGLRNGGAVAWMAHLGGFFIGLATVNLFTPLTPGPVPVHGKAVPKKKGNSKGKKK